MNWSSQAGGDWAIAVAGIGWVGRDVTTKDTLEINVFTENVLQGDALPFIFIEDLDNQKSTKLPMNNFVDEITSYAWQKIRVPIQSFIDNPGNADMTRIKTVFFAQNQADSIHHTLFLDDIRMTGGKIISGDSTIVIVVLGSSTAAGTGPSSPDSAWVNRYRKYIHDLDSTAYVINLAVGGYTTYDIMPTGYIPPQGRPSPKPNNNITYALTYKPSAIIINLPSNDVAQNFSIQEQLDNYDFILAEAVDTPVWITTTQPRNFSTQSQRDQLMIMRDSTYTRFGDYAIDFWTDLANADGTINAAYNSGDGVHINNAGHRIFYQRVVAAGIWEYLTTDISDEQILLPGQFNLLQNYPNPFNPLTFIEYELPEKAYVTLIVYDILGRNIETIQEGYLNPGNYKVIWDASKYSSGVYFYALTTQVAGKINNRQSRKMLLIK